MAEENESKKVLNGEDTPEENDEIIDLVEEITEAPADDEIIDLAEEVTEAPDDDEIIQLGDIADETIEPIEATPEESLDDAEPALGEMAEDIQFGDDLDDEFEPDQDDDDFVSSLGMDLGEEMEPSEETVSAAGDLSAEQIEAAIERVLMKILPEKIESILVDAIEKTVTKEINRLKDILSDE
jgi:hypothetical protein